MYLLKFIYVSFRMMNKWTCCCMCSGWLDAFMCVPREFPESLRFYTGNSHKAHDAYRGGNV